MPQKPHQRAWYERNRDVMNAAYSERYKSDSEFRAKANAASTRSYLKHRERIIAEQSAARAANKEQFRANDRAGYARRPPTAANYRAYTRRAEKNGQPILSYSQWCERCEKRKALRVAGRCAYYGTEKKASGKCLACRASVSARNKSLRRGARGSHTAAEWAVILRKHKHRCANCRSKGRMTRDHIIPLSRGGCDYAVNIQPLCASCNSRKHAKLTAHPSLFDQVA